MRKILLSAALVATAVFTANAQTKLYDFSFDNIYTATVGTGAFSSQWPFTTDRHSNANNAIHNNASSTQQPTLTNLPQDSSARTISLWFNRQGAGGIQMFSCGHASAASGNRFTIAFETTGSLSFGGEAVSGGTTVVGAGVSHNTWHHLAVTYDGDSVRVYFNGTKEATIKRNINTNGNTFYLGGMEGYFDDLKIYDYALTDTQVSTVYADNDLSFTITASATAGGTVSNDNGNAVDNYKDGLNAELTATPDAGYAFVKWTEGGVDVATDNPYIFPVTKDRTIEAVFTLSTSINPFTIDKGQLTIYPNPVNSILNVEVKENTNIKIVNLLGAVVGTQKLQKGNSIIDVSSLTSGVYFINSDKGGATKFIKQ